MTVAEYMQRKGICGKPRSAHSQGTFEYVDAGKVVSRLTVFETPAKPDFTLPPDEFMARMKTHCTTFLDELELVIARATAATASPELVS